jgi:hypothetical protein
VIIVVEGPSAAGKTTWIAAHCQPGTVIGETPGRPAPATGIPDTTPGPRDYSTGTDIFDALISQLPAR